VRSFALHFSGRAAAHLDEPLNHHNKKERTALTNNLVRSTSFLEGKRKCSLVNNKFTSAQQISNAVYKRLVSERVAFQRHRRNEGVIRKTLGLAPHHVTIFGANSPTS